MKKEAKLLLRKAESALVLSVEHFNRPSDLGRTEAVLILLDHSFEMLLKAAILHKGGRIREPRAKQTVGMEKCIAKSYSEASLKFLDDGQAQTIRTINSLRDASQHHLLDLSEQQLYIYCQAGLSVFRAIYERVFGRNFLANLPERVLPLSTTPPSDLSAVFDQEADQIKRLLRPKSRHHLEAVAKLRALAVMEASIQGEYVQPAESELRKLGNELARGKRWQQLFPGVATLELSSNGYGPSLDLRIVKKDGFPITLVPNGEPGATPVAVRRVNETSYYQFGLMEVSRRIGVSPNKTHAIVKLLKLQEDLECFKEIVIGKTRHKLYSQKAVLRLQAELKRRTADDLWLEYRGKGITKTNTIEL
ncbi:MAG: hypothetical protein HRF49_10875 [bacterium]|jgi:hypothetical protein